jgi:hypothetical protein
MGWARYIIYARKMKSAYEILFGKSEGESPVGRQGHRWEDNIKIGFRG